MEFERKKKFQNKWLTICEWFVSFLGICIWHICSLDCHMPISPMTYECMVVTTVGMLKYTYIHSFSHVTSMRSSTTYSICAVSCFFLASFNFIWNLNSNFIAFINWCFSDHLQSNGNVILKRGAMIFDALAMSNRSIQQFSELWTIFLNRFKCI